MKELEDHSKDKLAIQAEVSEEKRLQLLETIWYRPGHTIYEFNVLTLEITHAKIITEPVVAPLTKFERATHRYKSRVIIKENCVYTSALNTKNALRKFGNLLNCKITINKKPNGNNSDNQQ